MYRFGCQEFEIQRIDYQDGPEKSRVGDCIGPFFSLGRTNLKTQEQLKETYV